MATAQTVSQMPLQPIAGLNDPLSGAGSIGNPLQDPGIPAGLPGNPFPDPTAAPPPTAPTVTTGDTGTPFSSFDPTLGGTVPPDTSTTPAAPGAPSTGGGSGWADFLKGIGSGLTGGTNLFTPGGLGSALGTAIPYAGVAKYAQNAADKQRQANTQTIQPLITQANTMLDAANKQLGLFQSGTLSPGQQAQIDAYAASQKSAIAQRMASQGITDSSATDSANQQIENNALIMKSNFVQQSLTNALGLDAAGMTPLLTAVQDKLISDTQISDTMMQLMGTLASAWAYQTGQAARAQGGGAGGGGGAAAPGATSPVTAALSKYGQGKISELLHGPAGTDLSGNIPSIGSTAATAASGIGDLTAAPGLSGAMSGATDIGTGIASDALGGAAGAGAIGAGVGSAALPATGAIADAIGASVPELGGGAAAAGGAGGLGLAGSLGLAGLGLAAVDMFGNQHGWFTSHNSPVDTANINAPTVQPQNGQVAIPQGGVAQWNGIGGSGRIIGTKQGNTSLAMQATQGKNPGPPVLYPPGGNAYSGQGGWVLDGWGAKGAQLHLPTATWTNQATGQSASMSDPNFQKMTGITPDQLQQMYNQLTHLYHQG